MAKLPELPPLTTYEAVDSMAPTPLLGALGRTCNHIVVMKPPREPLFQVDVQHPMSEKFGSEGLRLDPLLIGYDGSDDEEASAKKKVGKKGSPKKHKSPLAKMKTAGSVRTIDSVVTAVGSDGQVGDRPPQWEGRPSSSGDLRVGHRSLASTLRWGVHAPLRVSLPQLHFCQITSSGCTRCPH